MSSNDYNSYEKLRNLKHSSSHNVNMVQDLYEQLNKKDKDLMMAAQIGKALLATNQELIARNEHMAQQFEYNMEVLEQEKYNLRQKLNSLQVEYEGKALELQNDIIFLRKEVDKHQSLLKFSKHQNSSKMDQLKSENIYMQKQLEEMGESETRLKIDLEKLKEQCKERKETMHQNLCHMEQMRQEITNLTTQKIQLEKKIHTLVKEKEELAFKCEDLDLNNQQLYKENEYQKQILEKRVQDIKELEILNEKLEEELDKNHQITTNANRQKQPMVNSLMEELENASTMGHGYALSDTQMVVEMQDFSMLPTDYLGEPYQFSTDHDNIDMVIAADRNNQENLELQEEIYEAYKHLKGMCFELKQRQESFHEFYQGDNVWDVERDFYHAGCLMAIINELRGLLQDLIPKDVSPTSQNLLPIPPISSPTDQIVTRCNLLALKGDLSVTKRYLNDMKQRMETQEIEMEKQIGNLQDLELKMENQKKIVKDIQNERVNQ